ncbi:hypothetical protein BGY98DRAFT_996513 [Russula aff. rugulosa BPL654]|nr:hypothetical protein BGY98DRAFT_996513 [Russula aff. rugulosa BPL654]
MSRTRLKPHCYPQTRHSRFFLLPSGVGKGSSGIGVEIVVALLSGDAHVVVTTSGCSQATSEYDQGYFQGFGSRASSLTALLFIKMLDSISTTNSTVSP